MDFFLSVIDPERTSTGIVLKLYFLLTASTDLWPQTSYLLVDSLLFSALTLEKKIKFLGKAGPCQIISMVSSVFSSPWSPSKEEDISNGFPCTADNMVRYLNKASDVFLRERSQLKFKFLLWNWIILFSYLWKCFSPDRSLKLATCPCESSKVGYKWTLRCIWKTRDKNRSDWGQMARQLRACLVLAVNLGLCCPRDGSRLSVTPSRWIWGPCPLLTSRGTTHAHGAQSYMQAKTPGYIK